METIINALLITYLFGSEAKLEHECSKLYYSYKQAWVTDETSIYCSEYFKW